MLYTRCSQILAVIVCSWSSLTLAAPVQNKAFNYIAIFGDSISDNGNVYNLTNGSWPADPAYCKGRFSNGPVWVEQLASGLGVGLRDLAYGSATANNSIVAGFTGANSTIAVPSVNEQIDMYTQQYSFNDTLAIIMIGLNDKYFDPSVSAETIAPSIEASVKRAQSLGAKNVIVGIEYDLSRTPDYSLTAGYVPAQNVSAAAAYSAALSYELRTYVAAQNTSSIALLDFYTEVNYVIEHASDYGFNSSVISEPCLHSAYEATPRSLCSQPETYLFFDTFHLTKNGHALFAKEAKRVISNMA